MTVTPASPTAGRHELAQYPTLDAAIRDLSEAVHRGEIPEPQARLEIAAMVLSSGLVRATVARCVRPWFHIYRHLHEDLVLMAENRMFRVITGESIDREPTHGPITQPTLDLEHIRLGASAVGYIRQGTVMNVAALRRNLNRGVGRVVTIPPMPGADRGPEGKHKRWREVVSSNPGLSVEDELEKERAHLTMETYVPAISLRRGSRKLVAQARAVSMYFQVPLAHRPLSVSWREHLLGLLGGDPGYALRTLRRARGEHLGDTKWTADLWRGYTPDDARAIIYGPRPQQAAHSLAAAALSPVPTANMAVIRPMTQEVTRLFHRSDAPVELVRPLVYGFVADELDVKPPIERPHRGAWIEVARLLKDTHPHILGRTVYEVRNALFTLAGADFAGLDVHLTGRAGGRQEGKSAA